MSGIQSVSVSASQSYATVGTQSQPSLQPFSNLNLTEAQRTQLRSVFQAAKQNGTSQADVAQQVNSILTPAQQKTLAADITSGAAGHHHHHGGGGSSTDASETSTPSTPAPTTASAASPGSSILATITNIQNQVAAAQSAVTENLQQQVLSTNPTPTA
jgi:hypothetical protein